VAFGLSDLFAAYGALGDAVRRFLWLGDSLEILEDAPDHLIVKSARGRFTFDQTRRAVLRKDRVLVSFDDIKSIDLKTVQIDSNNYHWSLWLGRDRRARIYLGRTIDDVQASIVAAHIARVTGKSVTAFT
jgi:hypothetical protein